MTHHEEISALDIQLQYQPDDVRRAEIILEILDRYNHLKSRNTALYADKLRSINQQLQSPLYEAWIAFYDGRVKYFSLDYSASDGSLVTALQLFTTLGHQKGAVDTLNQLAWNDYIQDDYRRGLDYARGAIDMAEASGYKRGAASAYNTIGLIYWNQGDFPKALDCHKTSLALKEQTGDKLGMAASYNNIGLIYINQGGFQQALEYFFLSLRIKEEVSDKRGMAGAYGNIGNIYEKQGNFAQALEYLLKGLKIHEETEDKQRMASAYHNIASIYLDQRNYTLALEYDAKSLKMAEQSGDRNLMALSYTNIGLGYSAQQNYDDALTYFLKSLMMTEETGNKMQMADVCHNIGLAYYNRHSYSYALEYASQTLTIAREIEAREYLALAHCLTGAIYTATREYDKATDHLNKSLSTATEMGLKQQIRDTLKAYSELKKAQGEWQAALTYYEKYIDAKEDLLNSDTQKKIMSIQFGYEMEQKEKEVEIHRLRNVELKAEKDRSEALLLNILPAEVAEELKTAGVSEARHFDNVTVLFTDFKNFTGFSEKLSAKELVSELHECFKGFDEIIGRYNIEKIKTVGDAYLAAAGVPVPNEKHAEDMVRCAIDIREFMLERRKMMGEKTFEVRIGLHSGHVVAGIVGVKKFSYDIWGDTVNTAARMEQNSHAGRINISGATYELVKDIVRCIHRGKVMAKNKGEIDMYFIQ
jgi:adenylate cyclase